jgi:hypothetical protein
MAKYKLSNVAKDDLIRIHQFGAIDLVLNKLTNTLSPSLITLK